MDDKTRKGAFSSGRDIPSAPGTHQTHPEYQPRLDAANEAERRAQQDVDDIGLSDEFKRRAAGKSEVERTAILHELHASALKSGKAKTKKDHEKAILKAKGLHPMTFDTFVNYHKGR